MRRIFNFKPRLADGFTLIEISIVISVLAILTTVGLASFVSYSRTQAVQSASYELITTLNLAKSRSFSQVKPTACINTSLDGYKVVILPDYKSYELDAVCSGGNVYRIQNIALPQNITFSASDTTSTSFLFPVVNGGVIGAGTIVLSGYGKTRTIVVDSVGTVK